MFSALVALLFLLCSISPALAGTCTFAWSANTESDLLGYRLYAAATSGGQAKTQTSNRIDIPLTALRDPRNPGYDVPCEKFSWWVATAYGGPNKLESDFSNEVQVPDFPPNVPRQFRLEQVLNVEVGSASITSIITRQPGQR